MKIPFVDLKAQYQSIKSDIDTAIANVIQDTAFIRGKYVSEFEAAFADFLGVKEVVSCANGTDSLEILLRAWGIGPGDEVIVPAMTWISTAETVSYLGATPVFVDAHPKYFTIDVNKIEEKITEKTKAIIPVHLYGLSAEMDKIMELAIKYDLKVLEDSAQAHGATYKEQTIGTIGHAGSFSFFPSKNLGAYGDAGAIVTNDKELAEHCRMIAHHGQKAKHDHQVIGKNSRLDGLQAAILSAKLPYLESWTEARIRNAAAMKNALYETDLVLPEYPDYARHVFHLFVVRTKERMQMIEFLKDKGIANAIHYPTPLPFTPVYTSEVNSKANFPVAAQLQGEILSLPMFPELSDAQIQYIAEAIKEFSCTNVVS
ncbi:MAG: DegT/DnrJ/EryC1/StrS family aminotransferase [Bacteroidota bacterium]